MRTLPAGLAALIASPNQQPAVQVTIQDTVYHWFKLADDGDRGRSAVLVTAAGTILRAVVPQLADPNSVLLQRVTNPFLQSSWLSARQTVTSNANGWAGCALSQTGSTIRLFYQRHSDSLICYRDSTDDGVTWGAEQVGQGSVPLGVGNYCWGIASDDINTYFAAYTAYTSGAAAAIFGSTYSAGSWSAWSNTGPPGPTSWGIIRGLSMTSQGGSHRLVAGVELKWGSSGVASAEADWSGASLGSGWSNWTTIKPMDNPSLGLTLSWPSIHFDAGSGLYYAAVQQQDSGSVTGVSQTRTTIFTSADAHVWTPWADFGNVFNFGSHALVVSGQPFVMDGGVVYSRLGWTGISGVSDDVLSLSIDERENEPASLTLILSNNVGQYNGSVSLQPNAVVRVSLGYGSSLVQSHTFYVDSYSFDASSASRALTIVARDHAKLLDYPSSSLLTYTNQTVAQLIATLSALASASVAPLPTTSQFSQVVSSFAISPGERWLTAMQRLASLYSFTFFSDATPRLRIADYQASDPVTWNYGSEAIADSAGYSADQANIIRVVGASPSSTAPIFSEVYDDNALALQGRERYRVIVDRLCDTAAKCLLKAQQYLREEQRDTYFAGLSVALNPAHELGDVITLSEQWLALANAKGRIRRIQTSVSFEQPSFDTDLQLSGV